MPIFLIAGILAALFALVLEGVLGSIPGFEYVEERQRLTDPTILTVSTLALFAIIEEVMKFSVLRKITLTHDGVRAFPLGVLLFSVGFGGTEIFLVQEKFSDAPLPAIAGILAIHVATIFLYGYAMKRRFSKSLLATTFFIGVVLHLLYNILLA